MNEGRGGCDDEECTRTGGEEVHAREGVDEILLDIFNGKRVIA